MDPKIEIDNEESKQSNSPKGEKENGAIERTASSPQPGPSNQNSDQSASPIKEQPKEEGVGRNNATLDPPRSAMNSASPSLVEHVVIEEHHHHHQCAVVIILIIISVMAIILVIILAIDCYSANKVRHIFNQDASGWIDFAAAVVRFRNDMQHLSSMEKDQYQWLKNQSASNWQCKPNMVYGSDQFFVSGTPSSQLDALSSCQGNCQGASLAVPLNLDQLGFLSDISGQSEVWTGFYQTQTDVWQTNITNGINANWISNLWASGQPVTDSGYLCAYIDPTNKTLYSSSCDVAKNFICQRHV